MVQLFLTMFLFWGCSLQLVVHIGEKALKSMHLRSMGRAGVAVFGHFASVIDK